MRRRRLVGALLLGILSVAVNPIDAVADSSPAPLPRSLTSSPASTAPSDPATPTAPDVRSTPKTTPTATATTSGGAGPPKVRPSDSAVTSTASQPPSDAQPVTPQATTPKGAPNDRVPATPTAGTAPETTSAASTDAQKAIQVRWLSLGGASGRLGPSLGEETDILGGVYQQFQGGRIWWSQASGAWETWDGIQSRYLQIGGPGRLGFPTSGEVPIGAGVRQSFTAGTIWWSGASGAWETANGVQIHYLQIGGPGRLGFPTSGEVPIGAGVRQSFTAGTIWWSGASGAWETANGVQIRYLQIGGPGRLGFPTSGEMAFGPGVGQSFQLGFIWWSAASGAWETGGGIQLRYFQIRGPGGLGFPVSAETPTSGGLFQQFQFGRIWWAATGAWETVGDINAQYVGWGGLSSWYGIPVGAPYDYYGGRRQDFSGGSLLTGVQPVLDASYARVSVSDVWATWRAGCPVGPESLTLVRLNFWGFDNVMHRGEVIVRSDLASRVASVFGSALAEKYPIRSMWRVDYYGGSDPASMAADNTSGFNCRQVTGASGLSPHSYGIAVDVNTWENPYYAGGRWWPDTTFVNRGIDRWGMLYAASNVTQSFRNVGFSWGGTYLDYQHFQFVG